MGTVFFTIILLLVFVASLFVFKVFSKRAGAAKDQLQVHADSSDSYNETKRDSLKSNLIISNITRWSVLAAGLLSVILLISMCFTTVSAKNVGVAVNFGAVSQNTLSPGIQPKFP